MKKTITFIGAGNMARSLVAGLTTDEAQYTIRISDPNAEQLSGIKKHWPMVEAYTDNTEAVQGADVIVLAVKPQMMEQVCKPLKEICQSEQALIISIAAGITIQNLSQWLDDSKAAIVRSMPNTPSLVQAGMTGLFASPSVSAPVDFSDPIWNPKLGHHFFSNFG